MRYLITILVLIWSLSSVAQVKQNYSQYGGVWQRLDVRKGFRLPMTPVSTKDLNNPVADSGQVYYDPTDSTLKYFTGTQWLETGGGGGGGSVDSVTITHVSGTDSVFYWAGGNKNLAGTISTGSSVCDPGEVRDIRFRVGDYNYAQLYENTYTNVLMNGKHVDVYRDGEFQQRDDTEYGFSHSGNVLTFYPKLTGLERITIRIQDGCFSEELIRPLLIIGNGESLITGYGSNSADSATATERAERKMKNLNGDNLQMVRMNIGNDGSDGNYNNYNGINRGGNETFARTHHGVEVGFANKYDSLAFGARPVYYTKIALGGTRILDWRKANNTTNYYDTLMKYVDTSIAQIVTETGAMPIVVMVWECGVNDQFAGMTGAAWEDTVKTYFSNIRADFLADFGVDTTYILMMKLAAPSAYTGYNDEMDDIAADDPDEVTYAVATTGATFTCEDASCVTHHGYTGLRNVIVQNFTTIIQQILLRYQ